MTNSIAIDYRFQENLAKAGKAIQAILDATGKNKGKIIIFVVVVVVVVVVVLWLFLLLLLFTSETYCVRY